MKKLYLLDLFNNSVGYLTSLAVFQAKAGFSLTKPRSLAEVVRRLKFPNNSINQISICTEESLNLSIQLLILKYFSGKKQYTGLKEKCITILRIFCLNPAEIQ
jgi:hypothetical protein